MPPDRPADWSSIQTFQIKPGSSLIDSARPRNASAISAPQGPCMGKFTCTATAIADLLVRLEAPGYAVRLTLSSCQIVRLYPACDSTVSSSLHPLRRGPAAAAAPSRASRFAVDPSRHFLPRGADNEGAAAVIPATAPASGRRSRA